MNTKIQKWGNSQGLRINKALLSELNINIGDNVNISVDDGFLIIKPVPKEQKVYKLEDLVKQIPNDYQSEETDWGKAEGKENW